MLNGIIIGTQGRVSLKNFLEKKKKLFKNAIKKKNVILSVGTGFIVICTTIMSLY